MTKKQTETKPVVNLSVKDNLDGEIFVFSDIREITLPGEPFKVTMPIFAVCTKGHATVRINLTEYELKPQGMLTILPDHIIHGYEVDDDFEGMFLCVTKQYIEHLSVDIHSLLPYVLDFKSSPTMELTHEELDAMAVLFGQLRKKIRDNSEYYDRKIIGHLLHAMLYELLNFYHSRNRHAYTVRSRSEIIFHSFVHMVEHGFKVDRTVAHYAGQLCISPKHLSVVVKQISGKTAGEWIDDYVILSAKVLLTSTTKTIKEISAELGFTNQSFFGKYFCQHTGMSPNRFRATTNKNPLDKATS